jgi:hypothetical protein
MMKQPQIQSSNLYLSRYSLDVGKTFRSYKIDKDLKGGTFRIQSIVTEPNGGSLYFVLFGKSRSSSGESSLAIHLDFSNIWPRKCETSEDFSKSDFEYWPMTNELKCTFGEKVQYKRRKNDRECIIDSTKDLENLVTSCECTYDDYECDEYYQLDGIKCVKIPNVVIPNQQCVNGAMKQSNGYIKKKISQCQGGLNFGPEKYPCSSSSSSWFFVIFAMFSSVGVFFMFIVYQSGGLGRHGRISLPSDGIRFGSTETHFERFVEDAKYVSFQLVYKIQTGLKAGWDWAKEKYQGDRVVNDYRPVSTYFDPNVSVDEIALHWEEDEH